MTSKPNLRIGIVQCSIVSNDIASNLVYVAQTVESYASQADLLVFPETITTGFTADASDYADAWESGAVYSRLKSLAVEYGVAIAGSYLVQDAHERFNRFFIFDEDGRVQWQDKRHLFSLGGEPNMVRPAKERRILSYRGWTILPTICYDLRFPVWCRNVGNEYDILVCVANWPKARREVWQTLLRARAMENLSYCIGVNRIGEDASGLIYTGDSALIDPRGRVLAFCPEGAEAVALYEIEYTPLADLRTKFPVWQDADTFTLQ